MPPEVAEELLLTLPRTQTLPVVKGQTAQSLLANIEKSRSLLLEGLGALTEAGLDSELELIPGRKMAVRRMLALLPQHQGQHFGHMQYVKKALG